MLRVGALLLRGADDLQVHGVRRNLHRMGFMEHGRQLNTRRESKRQAQERWWQMGSNPSARHALPVNRNDRVEVTNGEH